MSAACRGCSVERRGTMTNGNDGQGRAREQARQPVLYCPRRPVPSTSYRTDKNIAISLLHIPDLPSRVDASNPGRRPTRLPTTGRLPANSNRHPDALSVALANQTPPLTLLVLSYPCRRRLGGLVASPRQPPRAPEYSRLGPQWRAQQPAQSRRSAKAPAPWSVGAHVR